MSGRRCSTRFFPFSGCGTAASQYLRLGVWATRMTTLALRPTDILHLSVYFAANNL
jgi:hypothetical protein